MQVNANQQNIGGGVGTRGVMEGQGPWGKPDKVGPAVQLLREHSGLTQASSGGSGTLNNPVHKVPKVGSSLCMIHADRAKVLCCKAASQS